MTHIWMAGGSLAKTANLWSVSREKWVKTQGKKIVELAKCRTNILRFVLTLEGVVLLGDCVENWS